MALTRATVQSELEGVLHGTSLDKVTNIEGVFNRAARQLLTDIDPRETARTAIISNGLFDQVYDYATPTDLKGDKIIDIKPQGQTRSVSENVTQTYYENFDLYKTGQDFVVQHDGATKYLRISKPLTAPAILNGLDGLTDNGTWAASGGASALAADTITKVLGGASLRFTLDGASAGIIENSTMTQVDLTDHDEKSSLFAWVYLPTASITNVILRWGNDSSNYWSRTVTAPHFGSFKVGWNLCRFDWSGATETGTVTPSTIDYLRVTITFTGSSTAGFRVDQISSRLPEIYEIVYYSKYLFANSGGTFIETTSSTDDTINLDTDSYNVFFNKLAELALQQMNDPSLATDIGYFRDEYAKAVQKYKDNYPTQKLKPQQKYYRIR